MFGLQPQDLNSTASLADTGIYIAHSCFGGRAKWGAVFGGYAQQDGNGCVNDVFIVFKVSVTYYQCHRHGTSLAAAVVCSPYGIATSATIIAVKVLSDAGAGAYSDVISGVNYASSAATVSGKPSIALMSLGGSVSAALDAAVNTVSFQSALLVSAQLLDQMYRP